MHIGGSLLQAEQSLTQGELEFFDEWGRPRNIGMGTAILGGVQEFTGGGATFGEGVDRMETGIFKSESGPGSHGSGQL